MFNEAMQILKGCQYLLYGSTVIIIVGLITKQGITRWETYVDRNTGEELQIKNNGKTPETYKTKDEYGRYRDLDRR